MENTFRARYETIFSRVCAILGDNWRIDRRLQEQHRISLINPGYRNYSISARLEKDRIHLVGGVRNFHRSNTYSSCTVSPRREAWAIAQDIKRKILVDAATQIATFEADRSGAARLEEDNRILVNLLKKMASVTEYHNIYDVLCRVRTAQGICGDVKLPLSNGYRLNLDGLSKDQLIKVIGFLSTLDS